MRRPSLSATTWAALGLHLIAAFAVSRLEPRSVTAAAPAPPEALDFDLERLDFPTSDAPGTTVAAPPPALARAAAIGVGSASLARSSASASREGDGSPAAPDGTEPAPVHVAEEGAPVLLVRPGYAPAPNPFVARPHEDARTEAAEANARAEQVLRQPARERELELGLGPDGPVRAALADAASAGATDVTGKAVFRAFADGTGNVVSVTLLSCDGGRIAWDATARAALEKLRGTKLRLPSSAKGAEVTVEVSSAWKMPSGRDPGVDFDVLGIPVTKGEGKTSTKVSILKLPTLRTVELAPGVNVTVPQLEIPVLHVNGDPADIGAKPRRIVHTRVVESRVL